jgi:hypothetical protein
MKKIALLNYIMCICIYEHQFGFEIQNQKMDRHWKTEYQAADSPPMDRGPSAISGTGQSG